MGDFLEYPDILQEVRGALNPGRLKMQSDKIIFRNVKTGKVDTYNTSDIEKAAWLVRARGYCLKFTLENGNVHRYDGLKDMDYDKLASFVKKNFKMSLDKKDLSLKGWNWGTAEFKGNNLDFLTDDKTTFEVPLSNVSHSTTGKNEVAIEFHQNDDAPVALVELRFHIPTDSNPEVDAVEEFYKNVMSQADVIQATGDAVAVFSEVQCLTPRGRYDVKIYGTFLQLHGKTFDYKIPYTTILRLFLLPHRDGRQMFFVISLDPPIKQGQTRYHFLIALFNKDVESTIEISLSEEVISEKYEGKLQKEMSGLEYEIISRIMKTLVNRKITVPGNFIGHSGTQSIQCSYKAATGFLYPLERGFIFIHKPPMHIRFDEVGSVNFARSSGSTRSFDFEVETKTGTVYTFVGMEKDEYGKLYDFVTQKKLRVKNVGGKLDSGGNVDYGGSDDDSDEGGHDAYLHRMKAEGKQRDDDEDEDESTDDDYVAPESGSEVAEEYDTDAASSDSSSSEGGEGGEKKHKKKREKTITIREPGFGKPRKKKEKGEGGSKKSKKKGKKDPNMPKRPLTSYFIWLNENREKMRKEYPELSLTEFTKKAGEIWQTIEDKSKYEEENKRLKVVYEEAMEVYKQNLKDNPPSESDDDDEDDGGKKSKKKKSPKSSGSPVKESKAGSGSSGFKSKEFISDSESAEDSDDKPLKKKAGSSKKKKDKSGSEEEGSPSKKKSKKGGDDEFEGLPSDEEILSSPEASASESGSGSGED